MGSQQSRAEKIHSEDEEVNFDHFLILRAIGKGSFGKVCIVQKKETKQMYAMKYMHKSQCIERDAVKNVLREVEILANLEHPFLVNLWFSFQDEEDLFMVSDLLLGGDLRYHLGQEVAFSETTIILYICELGLALDYLQTQHILHRDIKPDNILLDEEGHAHITDFNIAAVLKENQLATSMSGTKPYIAPEVFACAMDECVGYSYPADWWSLGVTSFELFCRARPYDIHSGSSISDIRALYNCPIRYPSNCSSGFNQLLKRLLNVTPGARVSCLEELKKVPILKKYDFDALLEKRIKPPFTPPRDHLNCDPTFELEEMIVEAKPLHKKKKRLAKQRSLRGSLSGEIPDSESDEFLVEFLTYNREKELIRRERERKENDWEKELMTAMSLSTIASDKNSGSNLSVPKINPERRRSSCSKLPVSPLSVQTRIAASSSRVNLNLLNINDKKQSPNKSTSSEEKSIQNDNQPNKLSDNMLTITSKEKTTDVDDNRGSLSIVTTSNQSIINKTGHDIGGASGTQIVITTDTQSDLHDQNETTQ